MTLTPEILNKMDAYWRAANYLSVGQIYLRDNPLLKRPLQLKDIKQLLLGHWGTTPGQNFIYVHLNRIIKEYDLNMIYISGPGHGGPALVSNTYLEGTFSEYYDVTQDEEGLRNLFKMFSFPGGLSSHVSPQIPGSMHEGGELGYSLSHAFGAAFDNPDLIVSCIVGDGEAETGPLATSWHSNKFLNPKTDGAVLPILHLNGYKISNPTILARIDHQELEQLFRGYGWNPYFVEGDDPEKMHRMMYQQLDKVIKEIKQIQAEARNHGHQKRPRWPMIILNSPKGWTGPKQYEGQPIEGNFRSHQVPIPVDEEHPQNLKILENWMLSYKPSELFDDSGKLKTEIAKLAPSGTKRMGANRHVNGGVLRELHLPDFRDYAITIKHRGLSSVGNTHALGPYLRDTIALNKEQHNFRIFGPDEAISNRLEAIFETTNRQWDAPIHQGDQFLSPQGAVFDSMLSEHQAEGWLEGYLLTGRHGIFHSYEAFIRIVDSMVTQHAKWIKMSSELPWRHDIPSLNYLLTSHVWRQDHNGFTHQDPGFIDHLVNKKSTMIRIYLPPDANCLLSTIDHCLGSRNYINLTITGKHESPQWLKMDEAIEHCSAGLSVWEWASTDHGQQPDVVMACAGDIPTLETLAAVSILATHIPNLKIRVINVVDLMRLQPNTEHPHGLSDPDYDELFTKDSEIIFAFHGYPWLIHRLTYRRNNRNLHVRGYKEEGTITTAFDMTVRNEIDRFHLVMDVLERAHITGPKADLLHQEMEEKLIEHTNYINEHGIDMPEIRNWQWKPLTIN
jgi:xylulose-5-phosphate/fructose-6-phosphate phosphoketolase